MEKRKRYLYAAVIALLSLCLNLREARAQQLAIKTNALSLAALTPSLGVEGVVGERMSLGLSFFGHYRPYGMNSKLLVCRPELRYWFAGRALTREFVGVTLAAAAYNTTVRNYVHDGYAFVAGVTGGYAFNLGKRWNIELSGGLGFAAFAHKRYGADDNYPVYGAQDVERVNSMGYKIIPVNLGITFSYIIL